MVTTVGLLRSDPRTTHVLTRGNVDGIVSAAILLRKDPSVRVSFVPSGDAAVDVLRRDISSKKFYLVDLGLTPKLVKTLQDKSKTQQSISYLDHHQMSLEYLPQIPDKIETTIELGASAARVLWSHHGRDPILAPLVSLADQIEYCETPELASLRNLWGEQVVSKEARMLDFCWRLQIEDDRFRFYAARKLAEGRRPSEVSEIRARYTQIINEGRWQKALDAVHKRMQLRHGVGLMDFGRRKPNLHGFGARAVSEVARMLGCDVAALINRRPTECSASLRRVQERDDIDLGRFAYEFTQSHGIVGGGHPSAAGAKIPAVSTHAFLKELHCLT